MIQRLQAAVKRHLDRTASFAWEKVVRDRRDHRGRRWMLRELMEALWNGVLSATANLRKVEQFTERLGERIPDTTLHDFVLTLSPGQFREHLVREVRAAHRAKELAPDLPFSQVAIDGKSIWSGSRRANRYCQKQSPKDGATKARFVMRVLRAEIVGGPCKVCIGQKPITTRKAETSTFPAFLKQLRKDYGRSGLLEVLSLDAGFTSHKNAGMINEAQLGYVMALKAPQKELRLEAERLLGKRSKPDAETPWERRGGNRIRRLLFRTSEIAGYHGWTSLREVWRVKQETERNGQVEIEERYFLTNLVPGRTKGDIPLRVVRAHWGIENNGNWTLDTAWLEDSAPWVAKAAEVVSLLRLIAFNVVMRLRTRHLRSVENRRRSWRNLIDLVTDVLLQRGLNALARLADKTGESGDELRGLAVPA